MKIHRRVQEAETCKCKGRKKGLDTSADLGKKTVGTEVLLRILYSSEFAVFAMISNFVDCLNQKANTCHE